MTPSSLDRSLLDERLRAAGLDLTAAFDVAWYNAAVADGLKLPTFGRASTLAVLVGNSRALWPAFRAAVRVHPTLANRPNPLDEYVVAHVSQAARRTISGRYELRFGFEPPPRLVGLVTAAEVSGLGWRAPTQLAVHPVYGAWIALRAVVIVDAAGPENRPEPASACTACPHACEPALQAVLQASAVTASAVREHWRTWVDLRDACPTGREHRYSDDAIRFHYAGDRRALTG